MPGARAAVIRMPLDLAFKGSRDYLQGPDLLAGLLNALDNCGAPADGVLAASFYRKTGLQPDIGVLEEGDPTAKTDETIGHWSAECGGRRMRGWYLQTGRKVEKRRPYEEDSVVAQCVRGEDRIAFDGQTDLTATELCVAMTKALHIARFPLAADRHWAVCQFALARPLRDEDKADMRIELGTTLGGRLTKSALYAGDTRLGEIFFSPASR